MEITENTLRALVREADEQHRDGMATIADDISELHHASRTTIGRSRRELVRTAALAGAVVTIGGAVLPIGGLVPAVAQENDEEKELDDPAIAAFAESVELAAVEAYKAAAASGKVTTKAVSDAAGVFLSHHQEHAVAFASASGGKATGKANPKLLKSLADALSKAGDENAVVKIALDAENAAAATYLFALGALKSEDALKLTASILPIESAHAVTLAQVLGLPPTDRLYLPPFETQEAALLPDTFPLG